MSLLALHTLKILFIDANPGTHERVHLALGNEFAVRCVSSVTEAKDSLEAFNPDILISEIIIGRENGLDLCRYIRSRSFLSHLGIMLLTSQATLHDKIAGFTAGADDYVVKPYDARSLRARVKLLARIKDLERQTTC